MVHQALFSSGDAGFSVWPTVFSVWQPFLGGVSRFRA
jgi:hypothetical protein